MTPKLAIASSVVFVCGCAAQAQQLPAPATLAMHGEASGLRGNDWGTSAGADVGFQAGNCCGAGAFITRTGWQSESDGKPTGAKNYNATEILEGGVEIMAVIPGVLANRFRLRIRGAKIGTPPSAPRFGRTGYSGSFALLFRLTRPELPTTGSAAPAVDVFAGGGIWGLGHEQSSAGSLNGQYDGPFRTAAVLLGLRLGVDYGIDLK